MHNFHRHALTHWNFVGGLNLITIFLAIFSKEKVEDEMTTTIRLDTLLYLAITYTILYKMMIWINMWRMRNEE